MWPQFTSFEDYRQTLQDPAIWAPFLEEFAHLSGLNINALDLALVGKSTFPVFVGDAVVIKLVGFVDSAPRSYASEVNALGMLRGVESVPNLLTHAVLNEDPYWAAIAMSRMQGSSLDHLAPLSSYPRDLPEQMAAFVKQIHLSSGEGFASLAYPTIPQMMRALTHSRLTCFSEKQVEEILHHLPAKSTATPVNGDLWATDLLFENGLLRGVVDWGDSCAAAPAYELVQLYFNLFQLSKPLMRRFIDASQIDWQPYPMMALSLVRQARMIEEHGAGDVFYRVPKELIEHHRGDWRGLAEAFFSL